MLTFFWLLFLETKYVFPVLTTTGIFFKPKKPHLLINKSYISNVEIFKIAKCGLSFFR